MTEEEADDIELKLNAFREVGNESGLTDWEWSFLNDQVKRYEEYGDRTRFSDKQMAVIDRVYEEKLSKHI